MIYNSRRFPISGQSDSGRASQIGKATTGKNTEAAEGKFLRRILNICTNISLTNLTKLFSDSKAVKNKVNRC